MTNTVFNNIAVIGAGTMGSGIAAQIANAGCDVLLLDLESKDQNTKTPALAALDRLLASDPPQLMHKRYENESLRAQSITTFTSFLNVIGSLRLL